MKLMLCCHFSNFQRSFSDFTLYTRIPNLASLLFILVLFLTLETTISDNYEVRRVSSVTRNRTSISNFNHTNMRELDSILFI